MPSGDGGMSRGIATTGSRRPSLPKLTSRIGKTVEAAFASISETLEAMSSKPSNDADCRLGPRAARPTMRTGPLARADAEPAAAQEKVLAEIAHELGNFFHKLYYWSDYLKERAGRQSTDSTAAQMLESTIRNLEGFLKVSLDYFHPMPLAFMRMPAVDLLEGLLFRMRSNLNGTPLTLSDEAPGPELELFVDPGQLSRAFEVTVRHLTKHLGADSCVVVQVRRAVRGHGSGLEVAFELQKPNEASPLFRTAEAGVEWALAQKVVALHGGELEEHIHGQGGRSVVIFLPLCPS